MKQEVVFYSEVSKLIGDLYLPDTHTEGTKLPSVILCHGFAGIREILLPQYAELFSQNGFAALVFDYRGFGNHGNHRGEIH